MSKKNKVAELAAKGNLSRAEIARQADCTPAFVTQTLGSVRKYRTKAAKEPTPKIEMCPGCLDDNCRRNGCMGA